MLKLSGHDHIEQRRNINSIEIAGSLGISGKPHYEFHYWRSAEKIRFDKSFLGDQAVNHEQGLLDEKLVRTDERRIIVHSGVMTEIESTEEKPFADLVNFEILGLRASPLQAHTFRTRLDRTVLAKVIAAEPDELSLIRLNTGGH